MYHIIKLTDYDLYFYNPNTFHQPASLFFQLTAANFSMQKTFDRLASSLDEIVLRLLIQASKMTPLVSQLAFILQQSTHERGVRGHTAPNNTTKPSTTWGIYKSMPQNRGHQARGNIKILDLKSFSLPTECMQKSILCMRNTKRI